jgi:hypothetical protein
LFSGKEPIKSIATELHHEGLEESVMDFIGPLPENNSYNSILTIADHLNSEYCFFSTRTDVSEKQLVLLFFDKWYCKNSLPAKLFSDHDKLFMSCFWHYFRLLMGIKYICSTLYHPQTNSASEQTNKILIQALRFHVEWNQKGWVAALPQIRFNLRCTINKSTGYTPFMLHHGRNPLILPLLNTTCEPITQDEIDACALLTFTQIIEQCQRQLVDSQDIPSL